jgi:uracil-DNA glycosylase
LIPEDGHDDVAALVAAIRACRLCRDAPLFGAPLPHEPRPVLQFSGTAPLLIAGQAPGTRVHATGRPFTDPSGVRLRDWLGLDEATFYDPARVNIAAMGFCFPGLTGKGADLPPRRECARLWHDRLFAARPPFAAIVAVGAHAIAFHLRRLGAADLIARDLTTTVGNWRMIEARTRLWPLPHPSWRNNGWLRRHPWFADELLPLLRARVAAIMADHDAAGRTSR